MAIRDLHDHIDRRLRRYIPKCGSEPATVISHASSLLEDVCKHILESRGESANHDLPTLAAKTLKSLETWITDGTSSEVLADIGRSCATAVIKLGAIRDTVSSAHGECRKQPRNPTEADARFALQVSVALAFYFESLWQKSFVEKTARELSPPERDKLEAVVRQFKTQRKISGIDSLPYSRQLEAIQSEFLLVTGVRPKLPELWRAILTLRKTGRLSFKNEPPGKNTRKLFES